MIGQLTYRVRYWWRLRRGPRWHPGDFRVKVWPWQVNSKQRLHDALEVDLAMRTDLTKPLEVSGIRSERA